MTANRNLLRMKFARVIEALAHELKCPLDEALKRFYSSKTYRLILKGGIVFTVSRETTGN